MKKSILVRCTAILLVVALGITFCTSCNNKEEQKKEEPKEVVETSDVEEPKEEPKEEEPEEPVEPEEPETVDPSVEPDYNPLPYYVMVNCTTNTVNVYSLDQEGKYTVPYKAMVCSSGLDSTPTPKGVYYLTGNRWEWLDLVGNVSGMYVTQITGDYLFHSVPYTERGNHGSLQPGEFDKLGSDASHGCIRLQIKDAKWIYENLWNIQAVEIYDSPNPGPLGQPTAPKIGNSEFPGWDPSDSVEGNPWNL